MSDKPILDIALDTSAFDAFRAKFDAYRAKLEETPSQWAEAGKTTATMTAQFSALVDKMAAMQAALAKLEQGQDQATVDQSTAADSWSRIAESGKKFAGDVKGATLSLTRWAGLSGLFSAILAGGGLYGISRMASGVASRRSGAMSYGLSYGEYQAYQNSFARLGNADGMLSGFNDAMTRADARAPLYALMGQNADRRLAGKDAAGALAEALPDIKRLADNTDPRNMEDVVRALGVDKLGVTGDVLRTARRMSPKEINDTATGYQNNIGPMGLSPEMALKWQAFTTAMDEAGAEIENHFAINLGNLAPGLTRLSDAVASTVDTMLKDGGAASKWLGRVNSGMEGFSDAIGSGSFMSHVDSIVGDVAKINGIIGRLGVLPWRRYFRFGRDVMETVVDFANSANGLPRVYGTQNIPEPHQRARTPSDKAVNGTTPSDPSQRKANRWINWMLGTDRPDVQEGGGMTGLRPKAAQKRANAAASGVQTPDQSPLIANDGSVESAYAYLKATANGGALRPGEIEKLHPDFALRMAAAIKEARANGLPNAGMTSAARGSGQTGSIFDLRGESLHPVGLGGDMGGIGGAGSTSAQRWDEFARKHGIYGPYGVNNPREFNHYQAVPYKKVTPDNPLRGFEYDPVNQSPERRRAMWEASGVPLPKAPNPDDKLSPIHPLHPHGQGQTNRVEIHDDGADSHIETTNKAVGPMVSPYGTL